MESHQLAKFTNSAVTPPVFPGTNRWKTINEQNEEISHSPVHVHEEDTLKVDQPEPQNFKPITNVERTALHPLTVNRDTLTAQFYGKIQELKNEHEKTLTLLNQFYENERQRCHSNLGVVNNMKRRKINHLVPDYLDYTENNTLDHGNVPNREADTVPGYSKKDMKVKFQSKEKQDSEKDYAPSSDTEEDAASYAESMDMINRMWDTFSVDDYVDENESGNVRPRVKKLINTVKRPQSAPVKTRSVVTPQKEWSPVITIPKPFKMTLRDEQKQGKSHTRSSIEVSLRQKIKEEEEEQEKMKKIRACEPPSHIYLPLYEEMCERREQRSRFNRENAIATTMALQKPFSFAERDEKKIKVKKEKMKVNEERELMRIKRGCMFEAGSVPYSVHDPTIADRIVEEKLYRKIKAKLRAEDLMKSSALPPRMHSHELMQQERRRAWLKDVERHTTYSFMPKTHDVPDFVALHRQEQQDALSRKSEVDTTTVMPFSFHTTTRSKLRSFEKESKIAQDDSFEEKIKSLERPSSARAYSLSDSIPARMTDSARLRIDNMRRSLKEADYAIARAKDEEREKKERKKVLAQRVKEKAALNDSTAAHAEAQEEKLQKYKKELRGRQIQYNRFLNEVKQRIDGRPLLFEQHNEKVAKAQAEKRYREILESSGLSDEFVENKSRLSGSFDDFEPLRSQDLNSTRDSKTFEVESAASEESATETEAKQILQEVQEQRKQKLREEKRSSRTSPADSETDSSDDFTPERLKHGYYEADRDFRTRSPTNKERPVWVKYWGQTPQPRYYHYKILEKKYFCR